MPAYHNWFTCFKVNKKGQQQTRCPYAGSTDVLFAQCTIMFRTIQFDFEKKELVNWDEKCPQKTFSFNDIEAYRVHDRDNWIDITFSGGLNPYDLSWPRHAWSDQFFF